MGLDTVELVMEFEDEFQISIPDRDAELIHTIGQTVDYIYERLLERRNFQEPIQCPAQHAFYKLRQGLISDMRVERRLICPAATIGSLLPERWQRRAWPRFARQHGLDAPRFQWATADRFHRPHETLGTLARELVEQDWRFCKDLATEGGKSAIFHRVQTITSEQLGVDRSHLRWETHYINDLNAD